MKKEFGGDYRQAAPKWGFHPIHLWELCRGWRSVKGKRLPIRFVSQRTVDRLAHAWNEDPQQLKNLVPQTAEEHWQKVVAQRNARGQSRASIERARASRAKNQDLSGHLRDGQKAYWARIKAQDPGKYRKGLANAQRVLRISRDRRTGRRPTARGRTTFLCSVVRTILRLRQRHLKDPALAAQPHVPNRRVADDLERKSHAIKDPVVAARYDLDVKDIHLRPIEHARTCPDCRPLVAFDLFSTGRRVGEIKRILQFRSISTAKRAISQGRAATRPLAYQVTTGQIAQYAGVSIGAVQEWADRGLLGPTMRGGRWLTFPLRVISMLPFTKYRNGLTTGQAAKRAGVTVVTVQQWCDDGLIEVIRTPTGVRKIDPESLNKFLSARVVTH